jgi:hypothetical protein
MTNPNGEREFMDRLLEMRIKRLEQEVEGLTRPADAGAIEDHNRRAAQWKKENGVGMSI